MAVQGSPLDVLYRTLGLLASGEYVLFGHPVAGNERLLRNPFRTVVLEGRPKGEPIDEGRLTQHAAYVTRTIDKMEGIDYSATPAGTLEDYKTVDYELYLGTVRGE